MLGRSSERGAEAVKEDGELDFTSRGEWDALFEWQRMTLQLAEAMRPGDRLDAVEAHRRVTEKFTGILTGIMGNRTRAHTMTRADAHLVIEATLAHMTSVLEEFETVDADRSTGPEGPNTEGAES